MITTHITIIFEHAVYIFPGFDKLQMIWYDYYAYI